MAVVAGLFLDLLGLFGNWVILGAVGAAWVATGFERFSVWTLFILAGLAILGEVLEFLGASVGAKKFGASRKATLPVLAGCILGAVLGTPVFPILGSVVGACLGAFIAATVFEYVVAEKRPGAAAWTGLGAALGKVAGLLAKLAVGFAMLFVAALMF